MATPKVDMQNIQSRIPYEQHIRWMRRTRPNYVANEGPRTTHTVVRR